MFLPGFVFVFLSISAYSLFYGMTHHQHPDIPLPSLRSLGLLNYHLNNKDHCVPEAATTPSPSRPHLGHEGPHKCNGMGQETHDPY